MCLIDGKNSLEVCGLGDGIGGGGGGGGVGGGNRRRSVLLDL